MQQAAERKIEGLAGEKSGEEHKERHVERGDEEESGIVITVGDREMLQTMAEQNEINCEALQRVNICNATEQDG